MICTRSSAHSSLSTRKYLFGTLWEEISCSGCINTAADLVTRIINTGWRHCTVYFWIIRGQRLKLTSVERTSFALLYRWKFIRVWTCTFSVEQCALHCIAMHVIPAPHSLIETKKRSRTSITRLLGGPEERMAMDGQKILWPKNGFPNGRTVHSLSGTVHRSFARRRP